MGHTNDLEGLELHGEIASLIGLRLGVSNLGHQCNQVKPKTVLEPYVTQRRLILSADRQILSLAKKRLALSFLKVSSIPRYLCSRTWYITRVGTENRN